MSNQLKPILCESETDANNVDIGDTDQEHMTLQKPVREQNLIQQNNLHGSKIFKASDQQFIPDFSDRQSVSSVDIKTPEDDVTYHCISTRENLNHDHKESNALVCKPETIENIIRKLDSQDDRTSVLSVADEHKEYITKSKFSTLFGEMRVDILSMINLLSVLNKNATSANEEIQKLKRDLCNLVNENNNLKEKVAKTKDEVDKRLLHVCTVYNEKIEDLTMRINKLDTEHNSTDDVKMTQDIKVTRKSRVAPVLLETKQEDNQQIQVQTSQISHSSQMSRQAAREAARQAQVQVTKQTENLESGEKTEKKKDRVRIMKPEIVPVKKEDASDSESERETGKETFTNPKYSRANSITDSNMDKNAAKFKVVPIRSKKSCPDSFGVVEKQSDDPIFQGNFRQIARRDNIENKTKIMSDSKTTRANRLGLQMSVTDKVSIKRR